jgi:putative phosphoesterase
MRDAVAITKPDAMIHLGDHYDDGEAIAQENPQVPFYQVPGNCDRYRCSGLEPEVLHCRVCGVDLYMTHGHLHKVKQTLSLLLADARASKAQAVLYGHTHAADCRFLEDIWILNPGSCGYGGGSCGMLEVDSGKIITCRVLSRQDLEEWK